MFLLNFLLSPTCSQFLTYLKNFFAEENVESSNNISSSKEQLYAKCVVNVSCYKPYNVISSYYHKTLAKSRFFDERGVV